MARVLFFAKISYQYKRRKLHKSIKQEVVLEAAAQYFERQVQLQDKGKKVRVRKR